MGLGEQMSMTVPPNPAPSAVAEAAAHEAPGVVAELLKSAPPPAAVAVESA